MSALLPFRILSYTKRRGRPNRRSAPNTQAIRTRQGTHSLLHVVDIEQFSCEFPLPAFFEFEQAAQHDHNNFFWCEDEVLSGEDDEEEDDEEKDEIEK